MGTGTLITSGGVTTATLTTTKLPVGTRSLTAVYGDDMDDQGSTSSALSLKVSADATTTALAASPTAAVYGQSVTLTASVKVTSPGAGTPTGTVTFKDGSTVLGNGTLSTSGGVTTATLTTTKKLPVGTRLAQTAACTATTWTTRAAPRQRHESGKVSADATTTALAAVPPTAAVYVPVSEADGQRQDQRVPGRGDADRHCHLQKDGSTVLGTGTLSTSGGVTYATLTTKLPVGTRSLTAVYGDDTDDQGSTSAALAFKVSADATTTALAASPTAAVYGQSVTLTASVKVTSPGTGTPTGTVTFKY